MRSIPLEQKPITPDRSSRCTHLAATTVGRAFGGWREKGKIRGFIVSRRVYSLQCARRAAELDAAELGAAELSAAKLSAASQVRCTSLCRSPLAVRAELGERVRAKVARKPDNIQYIQEAGSAELTTFKESVELGGPGVAGVMRNVNKAARTLQSSEQHGAPSTTTDEIDVD